MPHKEWTTGGGGERGRGGGRGGGTGRGRGGGGRGGGGRGPSSQAQFQAGSAIPSALLDKVKANEEENEDTRKFKAFRVGSVRKRKELRKEKKNGKKRGPTQAKRKYQPEEEETPDVTEPPPAVEKTKKPKKNDDGDDDAAPRKKIKRESSKSSTSKNTGEKRSEAETLKRLALKNPQLHDLLQSAQLVSSSWATATDEGAEREEKEMRAYEKKLGIKKGGVIGKAFQDDGLDFVLEGLDFGSRKLNPKEAAKERKSSKEVKTVKTSKVAQGGVKTKNSKKTSPKSDDSDEDVFGLEDGEDEDSASDFDDDENEFGVSFNDENRNEEDLEAEEDDDSENIGEDEEDEDVGEEEDVNDDDEDDVDSPNSVKGLKTKTKNDKKPSEPPKQDIYGRDLEPTNVPATKYVPPHLRALNPEASERQQRLRRHLQGLLNRLSDQNMDSILTDVEKCYLDHARNDVTVALSDLLLSTVAARANLLDSFVITHAAFIAALHRLVGTEFAAHVVQTAVERFLECREEAKEGVMSSNGTDIRGAKEANNLAVLLAELYNFQVVASVLVYDIVKSLVVDLTEVNVEILLKLIRASGHKLRQDDPTALKDVILLVNSETAKRDQASLSSRTKFMLEQISNLKNNKIKAPNASVGTAAETATKMKKFVSGLEKKRQTLSTGALRVSLSDIQNVDVKGKWWLVGASWAGRGNDEKKAKEATTEAEGDFTARDRKRLEDAKRDASLLKLARSQKMNTDVRRNIFVALMSSEDFADAFEKLGKLDLSEVQEREVVRVLLHCCGNERTSNPYYTHLAARLCRQKHSHRVTLQYSLWDFLRELGERDIGGLESAGASFATSASSDSQRVPLRRTINLAKFYGSLVASGDLGLVVLKTLSFERIGTPARLFLQCFFVSMFDACQTSSSSSPKTASESAAFGSSREPADAAVSDVFARCASAHPATAQGCLLFLHHYVRNGNDFAKTPEAVNHAKRVIKLAKDTVKRTTADAMVEGRFDGSGGRGGIAVFG